MASAASATRNALTIKPREIPADDPVRLSSTPAKPQPAVFVSMARVYESQGRMKEAGEQYDKALAADAQHADALVGLARLQHREGGLDAATLLYERALRTHPNNAVVLNDLGLCYARRGMLEPAQQSLEKAVAQDPRSKLYRNNLAVVLVETNQPAAAFAQMRAVHGDAVAHYNLGYMLQEKGQSAAAAQHFQAAIAIEPRMEPARQLLAQLDSRPAPQAGPQLGAPQVSPPAEQQNREPELPQRRDYPVNYRQPAPQENYPPADNELPPTSGQPRAPYGQQPPAQEQPQFDPRFAPAPQTEQPGGGGRAHFNLNDDQRAASAADTQPPANDHRPTVNYVQPPMNPAQPPANYVFPPAQATLPQGAIEAPPAAAPLPGELPAYLRGPERSAKPQAEPPQTQPSRASRWSN